MFLHEYRTYLQVPVHSFIFYILIRYLPIKQTRGQIDSKISDLLPTYLTSPCVKYRYIDKYLLFIIEYLLMVRLDPYIISFVKFKSSMQNQMVQLYLLILNKQLNILQYMHIDNISIYIIHGTYTYIHTYLSIVLHLNIRIGRYTNIKGTYLKYYNFKVYTIGTPTIILLSRYIHFENMF